MLDDLYSADSPVIRIQFKYMSTFPFFLYFTDLINITFKTSNARLRTRSSLSRRNTILSHNNLFIYSVSKNETSLNDVFSDIPIFQSRTSKRDFLLKAVVLHKPPIFQTKSNKIPTIWPQIGLLDIKNTLVNPYGKFMVSQKISGFP